MPLSMYKAAIPPLVSMLANLLAILRKAESHAKGRKIDPAILLNDRLYPDMLALMRQVQLTTDFAKGVGARLAGIEVPKFADTESDFAGARARIQKTVKFLKSLKAAQFDEAKDREIVLTIAGKPRHFTGERYLFFFALPNFYFHMTTAYAILRRDGVELGKRDFIGPF